jgi:hypothetical protein
VIGPLKITHELRLPYQEKTGECVEGLLILLQLQAAIDALAVQGFDTFLVTAEGKPFSKGGLANWFRKRCRAVGLIAEVIDDSGEAPLATGGARFPSGLRYDRDYGRWIRV